MVGHGAALAMGGHRRVVVAGRYGEDERKSKNNKQKKLKMIGERGCR
jgi:hypothetical protein